jgi:catechol 2,3-dioxygenase-like lactoylglutathione lyase family enzyme
MANPTYGVRANDATSQADVARIDMKLEVVIIPVSDVDRAKEFYERIGWRLNFDRSAGEDFRLVQFTPPGSCCSVHFGKNITPAKAFLIVADIEAARDQLVAARSRGRRVLPRRPGRPRQRPASGASLLPLARFIQRSRRQHLAHAGGQDP